MSIQGNFVPLHYKQLKIRIMAKNYSVSIDITMSKTIEVEANSEEEAIAKANEMVANNPYNYTNGFSHYVSHEAISAEEE